MAADLSDLKQLIVLRTDLRNTDGHKIRTGKLIAQGAHASVAAVLPNQDDPRVVEWLANSFTKVCVGANSADDLDDLYLQALTAGLIASRIVDNGTTEFGGIPTLTCIAIGPDTAENLAPITGHLQLL